METSRAEEEHTNMLPEDNNGHLEKPSVANDSDSDATYCELGDNSLNLSEIQSAIDYISQEVKSQEKLSQGQLVDQNCSLEEQQHRNSSQEGFQFTETTLFHNRLSDTNDETMEDVNASSSINKCIKSENIGSQSSDVENNSTQVLEGLTENLKDIVGSGDIDSFVKSYVPTEVVSQNVKRVLVNGGGEIPFVKTAKVAKPCSPPLTLNRPIQADIFRTAKPFPRQTHKERDTVKKILPIRNTLSLYIDTRRRENESEITNKESEYVDISTNSLPERKRTPSIKRKQDDEAENKENKYKKMKGVEMMEISDVPKQENTEMYNEFIGPTATEKSSRHGRKKKFTDSPIKEQAKTHKMSLREIVENLDRITKKMNLWASGSKYPSRSKACKMLADTKTLISSLQMSQKKAIRGKRNINHKVKEDQFLLIAENLASTINKAIQDTDQQVLMEVTQLQASKENGVNEPEIKTVNKDIKPKIKSILKKSQNETSEELSEPIRKHISFSEDIEEFDPVSEVSNDSDLNEDVTEGFDRNIQEDDDQEGDSFIDNIWKNNNIASEETEFSESILCRISSHKDNSTCDNNKNEKSRNDLEQMNDTKLNQTPLDDANSADVPPTEVPPTEPEPWTQVTLMSINAVRVPDPDEVIPLKYLPKRMLESVDWLFEDF